MQSTSRAEAERLLGIAEKLLQNRDLSGSKDFAILAQETEPLLEGSDQILAIVDVLSAAEKPLNNNLDWYSILQVDRRCQDLDLIKRNYRRLALLLHPDKNPFTLADHAFKLVADAWTLLSDPVQKPLYDKGIALFSRVDPTAQQDKLPVRRADERRALNNFWTACPYCYLMYEYPRVYEGYCLRCQNCERSFHGVSIPSLPPLVPGQEAYYCSWGFFPMGFVFPTSDSDPKGALPPPPQAQNWIPPPPPPPPEVHNWNPTPPLQHQFASFEHVENGGSFAAPAPRVSGGVLNGVGPKKRGRPRKVV